MRRILPMIMLSVMTTGTAVWAADDLNDEAGATTAGAADITQGYLKNEVIGIKPQVGVMVFKDAAGDTATRAAAGFTADMNIASSISKDLLANFYIGPSTGILFSHTGDIGANFVGTSPDLNTGRAGANVLIIPANLKAGYNFTNSLRLSAHGGGNLVYRSVANSLQLGASSAGGGSVWKLFPNFGADAEFALGKNMALMIRPDWTFTPGDTFFTGTLALNVPIG